MQKLLSQAVFILTMAFTVSCGNNSSEEKIDDSMKYEKDNHSFANPNEAVANHLNLSIIVNFDKKIISGKASYKIENNNGSKIIFDTDNLDIQKVTLGNDNVETKFKLANKIENMGSALEVEIEPTTEIVNIFYNTKDGSEALQWLDPQQTAGKTHPFLFTQGEAILTRSWIPIQDSPGIRITYNARVEVPDSLMAVMSATNPKEKSNLGIYNFKMEQSIPSYLIALAVGNLEFRELGKRSGVYAEPELVDKAAYEFEDTEKMLDVAEKLYGPYRWEQYDIIVLPPSFPFGGMENPRLTFATPTIIAGDKSLTALIAHEMAHSWSGNLVTNSTWDDFWLNEGFTVYFELRIMEELYGKDYANMLALLGNQDLVESLKELDPEETKLKLKLDGRNPDDGMTDIAYEKGCAFLRVLENEAGREKFDAFLTKYFEDHAFKTLTTEDFIAYLEENLIKPNNLEVNVGEWIYEVGIPDNKIAISSNKFELVEEELSKWMDGTEASSLNTSEWSTHEWLHFIRSLDDNKVKKNHMKSLDKAFDFTNSTNSEIACAWFEKSWKNGYGEVLPKMTEFLTNVGRRKFLEPLYSVLATSPQGKIIAKTIYADARANYHSVSTNTIDKLLGVEEKYKE